LLGRFPQSPLAEGVKLKLALALVDNHQAGLAVLKLKQLSGMPGGYEDLIRDDEVYPPGYAAMQITDSPVSPEISAAEGDQVNQLIDALYNFAPIDELAAALNNPDALQEVATASKFPRELDLLKQELNAVLAQRCLADENFAAARTYMSAPQPFTLDDLNKALQQARISIYDITTYVNDRPVAALSGSMETLTAQVKSSVGSLQKAKAMMKLGNAWADARGKLLVRPMDGSVTERLFDDNSDQAMERRRINGQALGFTNVDEELESRDELRHAARWWMRAARLVPGSQLAATARLKALEAIPRIADGSDFAFMRDVETNAAASSRELYQRLRTECPNSVEARQEAAYWSFPMHKLLPGGHPFPKFDSIGDRAQAAVGKMGYAYSDYSAFGIQTDFVVEEDRGDSDSAKWGQVYDQILALKDHAAREDAVQLTREVRQIRAEVRTIYDSLGQSRYLNTLDDLDLFLHEPGMTPEAQTAYIELRLRLSRFITEKDYLTQWNRIVALAANPALAPFQDYVDFMKAASPYYTRTQNADSPDELPPVQAGEYQQMETDLRAFLAKYPKSRKREAALLVLARSVHWLTTPEVAMWSEKDNATDPDAELDADTTESLTTTWREKFDYKRAIQPLDEYDAEFPNGRYAADIRNYRGSAAMRAHDWPTAIDSAIAALKDGAHPDLQPEASLLLANIFAQLADAESRPALLQAIRQRPDALRYLQEYLAKTWQYKVHPLRYLGDYLGDQLGIRLKEPPVETDDNTNS
jgi:hypothetical protein